MHASNTNACRVRDAPRKNLTLVATAHTHFESGGHPGALCIGTSSECLIGRCRLWKSLQIPVQSDFARLDYLTPFNDSGIFI